MTWDETCASKDKKQTNKDKMANYTLMAFNNEVSDSTKTPLLNNEIT